MSLEAMAKSRTRYAGSPEPARQPIIGGPSVDSKSPIDTSDRKNPKENFPSPEASVASLSESSSNCKYETSSEGHPRRVKDEAPRPPNPSPNEDKDYRVDPDTPKCHDEVVQTLRHVVNADASVRGTFDVPAIKERSESSPGVIEGHALDSIDRMTRPDDTLDRILSESSHSRQFKKIVAYIESMSCSDVSIRGGIASDAFTASKRFNVTESANFPPTVQKSYGIFNKTTGVTFLALNEENGVSDVDTRGSTNNRRYRVEKSRSAVKQTSTESALEIYDSLNRIAENPTPSVKSIFFPPDPDDCSITSELQSIDREARNSRMFGRNPRSDLDALSRIEDELVPLQNEFNKLAGKVRALNLTGPYKYRVDPCIGSVDPSSVISHDASGYFLHRAQVFYRNDLSGNPPFTCHSRSSMLPTVDNSFARDPFDPGASSAWRKNLDIDEPPALRRLRSSFEPSRLPCENSLRLGNNVIPFFHEKPIAYGIGNDFTIGHDDRLEKPAYFENAGQRSAHDRSNRHHWSQWSPLLPTEDLPRFHAYPERSMTSQHVQRQAASKGAGRGYTESDDNDFHFIDGKIVLPLRRKESYVDRSGREAPRKITEHSSSRRTSDGTVSINRVFSGSSQRRDRSSGETKNHQRVDKNEIYAKISNHDKKRDQRVCRRSKRSSVNAVEFEKTRISGKNRRESNETIPKRPADSHDPLTAPSTNLRISHPIDKIVDSPGNLRSLDVRTKTSVVSYSGVVMPGREQAGSSVSDDGAIVDEQRIKFTGTYTEHRIVTAGNSVKSEVSDSPGRDELQLHDLPDNPDESRIAGNLIGYEEDSRDQRGNGRHLTLPISEEKITIVPIMYTTGIPEQLEKFDLPTCPKRKTGKKRSSNRHRAMLEKHTDRTERSSVRNESFLSRIGSQASTNFASRSSRLTDRDSCVSGHGESSWQGQWRRDSRLSIAFGRSNTSISVSSTTINTERTLRTAETPSRTTMSRCSKVSRLKRDKFPATNSSYFSKTMDSNDLYSRRTQYNTPMNSARRRTNESSIGVRISPDDFLDDA